MPERWVLAAGRLAGYQRVGAAPSGGPPCRHPAHRGGAQAAGSDRRHVGGRHRRRRARCCAYSRTSSRPSTGSPWSSSPVGRMSSASPTSSISPPSLRTGSSSSRWAATRRRLSSRSGYVLGPPRSTRHGVRAAPRAGRRRPPRNAVRVGPPIERRCGVVLKLRCCRHGRGGRWRVRARRRTRSGARGGTNRPALLTRNPARTGARA